MILWLSGSAERDLRRIGDELHAVHVELDAIREATERVAVALERQPEPRMPSDVIWYHEAPTGET